MTLTFEQLADILIIKEHIDAAMEAVYTCEEYNRNFEALGQDITIYTREGRYEYEAVLMSDKFDTVYVLNNSIGFQTRLINEQLLK